MWLHGYAAVLAVRAHNLEDFIGGAHVSRLSHPLRFLAQLLQDFDLFRHQRRCLRGLAYEDFQCGVLVVSAQMSVRYNATAQNLQLFAFGREPARP